MPQRLGRSTPLLGIDSQTAIKEVRKKIQVLHLAVIKSLGCGEEPRFQVSRWLDVDGQRTNGFFAGQLVALDAVEDQHVVEVQVSETTFAQQLVWELAAAFHDGAEHLVVGWACE